MEAAGQLVRLFRDGLDYAFIRDRARSAASERGVLSGSQSTRILVRARRSRDQPVYESLQGERSWPSRTPRRCHVTRSRVTTGFTD